MMLVECTLAFFVLFVAIKGYCGKRPFIKDICFPIGAHDQMKGWYINCGQCDVNNALICRLFNKLC